MKSWLYKVLLTAGVLLICTCPLWLYFAPLWFGKLVCNPDTIAPLASGWKPMAPCAEQYIPLAIMATTVALTLGCLLTFLGMRIKLRDAKK